jgi:hypothetical protein
MAAEGGGIFPAPYDLCVARKERRQFISPKDGKKQMGRESDAHYHLHKSCLEKANPLFNGTVTIPPEVEVWLNPRHKKELKEQFQL